MYALFVTHFQDYFLMHFIAGFIRIWLRVTSGVHIKCWATVEKFMRNIVEFAENVGLFSVEEAFFSILFYPGYQNKRGDGNRSHLNFRVGNSSTFKFAKKLNWYIDHCKFQFQIFVWIMVSNKSLFPVIFYFSFVLNWIVWT